MFKSMKPAIIKYIMSIEKEMSWRHNHYQLLALQNGANKNDGTFWRHFIWSFNEGSEGEVSY